jgi:hypothetical protein
MYTMKKRYIVLLAIGSIGLLSYPSIASRIRLDAIYKEAARYGVSAEEIQNRCNDDFDGVIYAPNTPEEIAAICWEIRHPKSAAESG